MVKLGIGQVVNLLCEQNLTEATLGPVDSNGYGIGRAIKHSACLRVAQLLPKHKSERLAIIWPQFRHGFKDSIFGMMLRHGVRGHWLSPGFHSIKKPASTHAAATMLREDPARYPVKPQALLGWERNIINATPSRCEHIGYDIGGLWSRNYAANGIVVDGLIVSLIHEFEPTLSLDHGGAVTAHGTLQRSRSSLPTWPPGTRTFQSQSSYTRA